MNIMKLVMLTNSNKLNRKCLLLIFSSRRLTSAVSVQIKLVRGRRKTNRLKKICSLLKSCWTSVEISWKIEKVRLRRKFLLSLFSSFWRGKSISKLLSHLNVFLLGITNKRSRLLIQRKLTKRKNKAIPSLKLEIQENLAWKVLLKKSSHSVISILKLLPIHLLIRSQVSKRLFLLLSWYLFLFPSPCLLNCSQRLFLLLLGWRISWSSSWSKQKWTLLYQSSSWQLFCRIDLNKLLWVIS